MLLECVPNISEGRVIETLDYISGELARVPGAALLHRDVGHDANRSVYTIAGSPEGIRDIVLRLAELCIECIDMRAYEGSHPCVGALDVCPLIPLRGISLKECADIAIELASSLSSRFDVPIYLYEEAAKNAERRSLGNIRRGGFHGLSAKLQQKEWVPDFGPLRPHPSQGAWVFGARPLLIAFNVNLSTKSVDIASRIASRIRTSSSKSPIRLPSLKAIGWYMPEFSCAQVSCNLPDFSLCGLKDVFDAISREADREGCRVLGSEPIGLLPEEALRQVYAQMTGEDGDFPPDWLEQVVTYLGLDALSAFNPEQRILERVLKRKGL